MMGLSESKYENIAACNSQDFECQISSYYLVYREKLVVFFSIFCCTFVIYASLYHFSAYL